MLASYKNAIEKISKKLNAIGEIFIVLSMLMIVLNILLRSFLNKPLPGIVDYVGVIAAIIVGPTLAYTAVMGGHLEVDFILSYFPQKIQRTAYLLVNIVNSVFLSIFTWFLVLHAQNAYVKNEVSMTVHVPFYPFILAVALGMGVFTLYALGKTIELILGKEVSE